MVKYLKYKRQGEKEQSFPIRISYYVLRKLKEQGKSLLEDTGENYDIQELMFFLSCESGAKAEGKSVIFTQEEVPDVLDYDDNYFKFIEIMSEFFNNKIPDISGINPPAGMRRKEEEKK